MVDARKEFYARAENDVDRETEKILSCGKFIGQLNFLVHKIVQIFLFSKSYDSNRHFAVLF